MARKYIPSQKHFEAVEQMSVKNISYAKMAKALGISLSTFKTNLTLFDPYIKKGRDTVDQAALKKAIEGVENSLLKKCLGFEYEEIHTEITKYKDGTEKTIIKTYTRHVIPSDQAIFYYLGNRAPDKWQSVNYSREKRAEDEVNPLTADETRAFMLRRSGGN